MNEPAYTDIIVAIHGIGAQMRSATIRSVATRLAASKTLTGGLRVSPVAPQPLGFFHTDIQGITSVRQLDDASALAGAPLEKIGFSEVFWADVPQQVVEEGRTLEETKAWARTVVARARVHCDRARHRHDSTIVSPDFTLASEVVEEIVDTIYVLENISSIADKAGLFTFDVRKVMQEYVDDVQLVTEFSSYRTEIVGRFHRAMEDICTTYCRDGKKPARLHVVAHSEGTVVSFLGLLHAMSRQHVRPAADGAEAHVESRDDFPGWLKHVHGYMTMGSPIDKHLLLWPRLWENFKPELANGHVTIRWRNYYDFGDPVGFKLDTARRWLGLRDARVFEFEADQHDIGFARYLLPGKAHNDYWDDPDVFEHFIADVVTDRSKESKVPKPRTRPFVYVVSPLLPYVVSACVLMLGVYFLYKGVVNFTLPELDGEQAYILRHEIGVARNTSVAGLELFKHVASIAALLAGITVLARMPRLAGGAPTVERFAGKVYRGCNIEKLGNKFAPRVPSGIKIKWSSVVRESRRATTSIWYFWATLGFALGCACYVVGVDASSREYIGGVFRSLLGPQWTTKGVILSSLIVSLGGMLATTREKPSGDRRQRRFLRGMRPLLALGMVLVSAIVIAQLVPPQTPDLDPRQIRALAEGAQLPRTHEDQLRLLRAARFDDEELNQLLPLTADMSVARRHAENLIKVEGMLTDRPPVWPVVLHTALFFYLWWLATLLFDLAFVWQRYVRQSVANDRMAQWAPDDFWGKLPVSRTNVAKAD